MGYGVGYPFGLFGLIAFVYLTPRRLGIDLKQEASRVEAASRPTPVQVAWFVVENPLLEGHTLDDVSSMHLTNTLFSRLARGDQTLPARGEMVLHRGDHLRRPSAPRTNCRASNCSWATATRPTRNRRRASPP